jgi:hypothetical protein
VATPTHALNIDILINQYDLTEYFNSLTVERTSALAEVPAFGKTAMERVAGPVDGSISADGWFDSGSTSAIDPVLAPLYGTAGTVWSSAWAGFGTLGNIAVVAIGALDSLPMTGDSGSAISLGLNFTPDSNGVRRGWVLRELTARTADSAAGSTNDVDTTTTSSNGYAMNQHTTAITSSPTLDLALYDSADGATFAAVVGATFTQITAAGYQQKTGTTSIRRYVAIDMNYGGTGGTTTAVTFAKL